MADNFNKSPSPYFDVDVNLFDEEPDILSMLDGEMVETDDQVEVSDDEDFHANILDEIDETLLESEIRDLADAIDRDFQSRSDYDEDLRIGIKELGFSRDDDASGFPFPGASKVKIPIIAKSAIQYQSHAKKELFPQSGAARAVLFKDDEELEEIRLRAEQYFNLQITGLIPGYAEEMDKTLLMLPLYGSVFRKVYYDGGTPKVDMIPVMDFLVPWSTKSLDTAPRMTQILRLHKHEVEANFRSGLWKKADLAEPDESNIDIQDDEGLKAAIRRVVGVTKTAETEDDRYVIYEVHTYLSLEDDEDLKPYIVTFDAAYKTPLSVVRNWEADDDTFKPRQHFVHYKYLPWDSFYGLGLIQLLGGLQRTGNGVARAVLDKAMQNNMTGGLINAKAQASGQNGNNELILAPNTWTKVQVPAGSKEDIRSAVLPFSQLVGPADPSLLAMLDRVQQIAEEFGSISMTEMMSADKQAPVGTILALIEQQGIIYSAVHERQWRSLATEFKLIQDCNAKYLGGEEGIEVVAYGSLTVTKTDFGPEISIKPAADPAIFSSAQRVSQVQAALQIAQQAKADGVKTDLRQVYIGYATALGIKDVQKVFPAEDETPPPPAMNPVSELQSIMQGKPAKAYPEQNHLAHVEYLTTIKDDPFYKKNITGERLAALEALIADHVGAQAMQEAVAMLGMPLPPPVPQMHPGQTPAGGPPGMPVMPPQQPQIPPQVQSAIAMAVAGIAQQMASQRPQDDKSSDNGRMAVAAAETQRKSQADSVNAELRVADMQYRIEKDQSDRALREAIELEKLNIQREQMVQDSTVVAAQSETAMRQKAVEISNKKEVEMARLQAEIARLQAELASKERMASAKIESDELQTAAQLASKEQIEAAKIVAADNHKQVDFVDRRLGEIQKIDPQRN